MSYGDKQLELIECQHRCARTSVLRAVRRTVGAGLVIAVRRPLATAGVLAVGGTLMARVATRARRAPASLLRVAKGALTFLELRGALALAGQHMRPNSPDADRASHGSRP